MLFMNTWLLVGLFGVSIPVILHLIRRQSAKPYDWGAMRFLIDTVAARRKRLEWEDLLLMIARCLLIALLVLALARPYVPPDSRVAWLFVLPLGLLGIAFFGGAFVISSKSWKRGMWLSSALLIGLAAFLIWQEKNLNLMRFQTSERRDVALIIDGSTSMMVEQGGRSSFLKAIEEAKDFVKEAPKGTAFSVILGGPAPELKTATPLTHRADVIEVLDQLEPIGGPFRAHEALGMATLSLAEGRGSMKDLVVFTDIQRLGWQFESPTSWGNLGEAWEGLQTQSKPRLMVRSFPPPERIRNVAIMKVEFSREVVGTDREMSVSVLVENTGTDVVTPGLMRVSAGEEQLEPKSLSQLAPGEQSILEFRHQFTKAGPTVVRVEMESNDDLPGDDRAERVLWVKQSLPVLIVEGNSGASFFERAGGYLALALSPAIGEQEMFIAPRVIEPSALSREELKNEAVVVLADVARLPAKTAARLSEFVLEGGGLWILAGPKIDPGFYQGWIGGDGPIVPMSLGEMVFPSEGARLASGSFDHPVLRLFKDATADDFGSSIIDGYRLTSNLVEGARPAARFSNGEVFLVSQEYGNGRVILSTTALDARMSNLPARPAFVPFVHETTNWLAGGKGIDLNVKASWSPTLALPGGGGLSATYQSQKGSRESFRRVDPVIDFDWENLPPMRAIPRDGYTIIWEGSLLAPKTGEYVFEIEADDSFELILDGRGILTVDRTSARSEPVYLEAGRAVKLTAKFEEEWGEAKAIMRWIRPDGTREVVPSSSLVSVSPEGDDVILGEAEARDPVGRDRNVTAIQGRRGKLLEVNGAALPGQYLVEIPSALRSELSNEEEIPLVVLREGEESRFNQWSEDDRLLIRREIDLIELGAIQDVLAALRGEGFGREIWKILAIAALILLFLEGFLARWVSKSRKAGEEVKVEFEHRNEVPEEFLKSLSQMKGGDV